jgi:hypothetical protein
MEKRKSLVFMDSLVENENMLRGWLGAISP